MRNRINGASLVAASAAVVAVLWWSASGTMGQATRSATMPDGKPNLNGIWQATTTANWDLLAHTMRPMVAQPGVYPDVPVLAAPVLALGAVGAVPPGPGVVEGNEIPYKPEAAAKKKENAEQRPGSALLHARHSARDVHALPVPDRAGHEQDPDGLRVRERQPRHSSRSGRPAASRHMDGTLGRALGREHPGRERGPFQRPDMVLEGGGLP
jgi:hypothetical protein